MTKRMKTMTEIKISSHFDEKDILFINTVKGLLCDSRVKKMKSFTQHGNISTYDHCLMVCLYAYMYAKRLKLKIDPKALARGAMLHDFFLYDWHKQAFTPDGLHGFSHPVTAERNARNTFWLSKKERGIIINHMWPLTLTRIPTSTEAWLVCIADKYCSAKEALMKKPY